MAFKTKKNKYKYGKTQLNKINFNQMNVKDDGEENIKESIEENAKNSINEIYTEDIFGNIRISNGENELDIEKELENVTKEMSDINELAEKSGVSSEDIENVANSINTNESVQRISLKDANFTQEELANMGYVVEEEEKPEKKGFFKLISSLFQPYDDYDGEPNPNEYANSRFKEYLFLLDTMEDDRGAIEAVDICDKALRLDRHMLYLNKKKREYEASLHDIACYDSLTDKEANYFKDTMAQYSQLLNDRRILGYQLNDFDHSINKLQNLEEDAIDVMPQLEDAENSKRLLKNDIAIIQSEKDRTIVNKDKLKFAYGIVHKFAFGVCIVLLFAIMFLSGVSVITNRSMLTPLIFLGVVLLFTAVLIFICKRKLIHEMKLNDKKYSKIVTLLNKKTVVYSYYVNFLNFSYNKYKVKNSRALRDNLNDFSNYKYILGRYDNLGKILRQVQENLEIFMKEKSIKISTSLETFAKSTNIANKIAYSKELNFKKTKIEERISEISSEHEEYWGKLVQINITDESKEKVVEKIMKEYLNEVERLSLENNSKEELEQGKKQPA